MTHDIDWTTWIAATARQLRDRPAADVALPELSLAAVTRGEIIEVDEHPVAPAVARAAVAVYAQHAAQDAALMAHTATWRADLFDEIVREVRARAAQQDTEARAARAGIPTVPINRAALLADRRAVKNGEQLRLGTLIYAYTSAGEFCIVRLVKQQPDRVEVEVFNDRGPARRRAVLGGRCAARQCADARAAKPIEQAAQAQAPRAS